MKKLTYEELKDKGLVEKNQALQLEREAQKLEYLANLAERNGLQNVATHHRKKAEEIRIQSQKHLAIYYKLREQALQIRR